MNDARRRAVRSRAVIPVVTCGEGVVTLILSVKCRVGRVILVCLSFAQFSSVHTQNLSRASDPAARQTVISRTLASRRRAHLAGPWRGQRGRLRACSVALLRAAGPPQIAEPALQGDDEVPAGARKVYAAADLRPGGSRSTRFSHSTAPRHSIISSPPATRALRFLSCVLK